MKKQILFLVLITLLIGVIAYRLRGYRPRQGVASNQATNSMAGTNASKPQARLSSQPAIVGDTFSNFTKNGITNWPEEIQRRIEAEKWEWKMPIDFYGRVIDESNAPVVGAGVHFTWNDLSPKGTSDADVKSDKNGFFFLNGKLGKYLMVTVSKDGYYSYGNSHGAGYEYANPADGLFKPDPMNPVVFQLRKRGVGVELITSEYGVKPYFGVTVPLDGRTVQADLLERKAGQGQITISQIKPAYTNWKQATNWSFRMEIPDGGFIGQNDEFPFTAPEEGYQSVVEFRYQKGQPDWVDNLKTNYYIKFGTPPRYGWLKLDTSILMEGARLTYAINPDGSRNLEPK